MRLSVLTLGSCLALSALAAEPPQHDSSNKRAVDENVKWPTTQQDKHQQQHDVSLVREGLATNKDSNKDEEEDSTEEKRWFGKKKKPPPPPSPPVPRSRSPAAGGTEGVEGAQGGLRSRKGSLGREVVVVESPRAKKVVERGEERKGEKVVWEGRKKEEDRVRVRKR
ncbi:hypothetical protein NKR19_g10330 [Coniochaeta hoffmannii]|uniref:Uncharacterized protein n=1 Tax=Coniochaeta hoffmannii TaxID=91930 RepID=A0AA38VAT9_9PEZI|nr:hypothetical protein NKR19_g10330 [Coniochaeta hoffmannii]